jgi:S1-C subfamily serine protease
MQIDSHEIPISESRKSGWLNFLRLQIRWGWLIAAGFIAAFLGILLYSVLFPPPTPLSENEIDERIMNAIASATPPSAYSAQVYQAILPSLVLIQTQIEHPDELGNRGVGSGVVINANGDILTALHVVADAAEIEVVFADGTQANAVISSAEPENDIAVLQPSQPPEVIVPAILGNSNAMRIGDETFAVGNPLGLTGSLSAGVISGFDRSVPIDEDGKRLEGLIQFDAAVNPGNSGGPLLNREGYVIGIVTALANPSQQDSFTGIGFAVPIATAGGAAGLPDY